MKLFFFSLWLFFLYSGAIAQDDEIVIEWENRVSQNNIRPGDEVDLVFKAKIPENWYLYSSDFSRDLGPKVTTFTFDPGESYELIGEVVPVDPSKKYDDIWEGEYTYFTGAAEFRQRIKVNGNTVVAGNIDYQVCSDIDGKCIPFVLDFEFKLGK